MESFQGKRVLVLGAAEAIGSAVVGAFHGRKAEIIAADFKPDISESEFREARVPQERLHYIVGEAREPVGLVDEVASRFGVPDILVCVPPPVRQQDILAIDEVTMRDVVERELIVPALAAQAAARHMTSVGGGRIIAFCSMSGKTGIHQRVGPYAAAKGGLIAYLRVMAAELAPNGVTVNAIATALFDSQAAAMDDEEKKSVIGGIPVGRFGRSEEAAHAAVYLASNMAAFTTGETLNLSGGRFMD